MLLEKLTLLLEEKGYLKNPETGKIEPGSLDTALKQYFDKILKDLNKEDLDEVVQDKSQYEKYLEAIIEYASDTYSGEPVIDYIKNNKSRLITSLMSVDALSESIDEQEEDPIDTITMDVPLFIRLLEYAREDAQTDMDLHDLTEKSISGTKQQGILSMDDYDMLVGELKQIEIKENIFKVGQKVTYLGHPVVITATREYNGKDYVSVSYDKGNGKTKASDILATNGDVEPLSEMAKKIYESMKTVVETIQLGHQLDESTLCKRGQDYIKARKAAGEKSSAYLSGRAVRVCKGDIEFKGKKQKDFKG